MLTLRTGENDHGYAMWQGKGSVTPAIIARNAAKQACLSTKAIDAQMLGVDEGFNDSLVSWCAICVMRRLPGAAVHWLAIHTLVGMLGKQA
jgi:hypothetical protein